MVMTSHPQGLTTLLTRLLQRDQRLLLRRFWTRTSASHLLAPCCTFLLLLCLFTSCFFPAYTCCQHRFAIQPKKNPAPMVLTNSAKKWHNACRRDTTHD